jgi:hypothetical protein
MSPVADLSAVTEAGRQTHAMYLSTLNDPEGAQDAISYLGASLGQGGTFDHRRPG